MKVKVNNLPATTCRYIVAKYVDHSLWYYGSWDSKEDAERVALELENGLVVENGISEEAEM